MKIDLITAKRYMATSSSHINKVCFLFKVFLSYAESLHTGSLIEIIFVCQFVPRKHFCS